MDVCTWANVDLAMGAGNNVSGYPVHGKPILCIYWIQRTKETAKMSWLVIIGKGKTREQGRPVARNHKAQCWGINNVERYPELTMLWEMHKWDKKIKGLNPVQLDTLPVMMQERYLDVPTSLEYPIKAMERVYGQIYANNTLAYMLMMAIAAQEKGKRRFTNIYLAGIDYKSPDRTELEFERACTEYWIGYAIAKGINVYWPEESNLCTYPGYVPGVRYGYTKGYNDLTQTMCESYLHTCAEALLLKHGKPTKKHDHNKFYQYITNLIKMWKE